MTVRPKGTLFPHQAEFHDAFLASDAPHRELLVAPPGMGKGHVAQGLADHVASSDSRARVLVLVPSAMVLAYVARLAELAHNYRIDVVDRRRLREILSAPIREDGLWSAPTAVVMSIDFAKQDDVVAVLRNTKWDLVVVDEAHALRGRRGRLVQQLADSASRLLLLTAVDESAVLADEIPGLKVTSWTRDVLDERGMRLFVDVPRAHHVIDYTRSEEEAAFVKQVLDLLEQLTVPTDTPQVRMLKSIITRTLSSSFSAIEQLLLRLRERLVSTADQELWLGLDTTAESGAHELDFTERPAIWRDREITATALADLVASLEELPRDSKADRFRRLIDDLAVQGETRVCVFSAFASTAEYLAEVVAESELQVETLIGSMTATQRDEALSRFVSSGGVLLLTDGVAPGLNFANAHHAVHYDLPEGPLRMEQRWGRLDRVGQTQTVHSYVLRDQRRAIEAEEQLLRDQGFIQ